mmetsp:Transcript_28648/g.78752  ORF Transcript_28648/g.78752 Transcript_28648/m.78752 type:complete len:106 (+) Transcript_28648:35-352(+)
MSSSGIAVGLTKGFPVEKRSRPVRPSRAKARISKRTKVVRSVVAEVVGMNPYERRMLDMLKTGGAGAEKRMYKFAKRRLGTHKRAVKKRELIKQAYSNMKARAAH